MTSTVPSESPSLSPHSLSAISSIESLLSSDEGGRGTSYLYRAGDLLSASLSLARLPPRSRVLILTGFPCCVSHDPPTETDGPPGAACLARCANALGYNVTVATDRCNVGGVAEAVAGLSGVEVKSFPPYVGNNEGNLISLDPLYECRDDMVVLAQNVDLIIAIERAGPGRDGVCRTMRGVDMTSAGIIAPLHDVVVAARQRPNGPRFIAIGDGGNELGMGVVYQKVCQHVKFGELIGAAPEVQGVGRNSLSADDLVAASVSNWGGYGLAAAAALVRYSDESGRRNEAGGLRKDELEKLMQRCLPSIDEEADIITNIVKVAGCRDGVSGKQEATVDGLPLQTSLDRLADVMRLAMVATEN